MVASLAGLRFLLMILLLCGIRYGACSEEAPQVLGLRLEDPPARVCMNDRIISAPVGATFKLRLFGTDLNGSWPWVAFARAAGGAAGGVGDSGDPCLKIRPNESAFQVTDHFVQDEHSSGLITVEVRQWSIPDGGQTFHHLCVLRGKKWTFVGPDRLRVDTDSGLPPDYIPPWGLAVLIVLFLTICCVLRTVNLSLLWLDPVELYVLHSCGSEEEKRVAKRLEPVRRRGNFLVSFWRPVTSVCFCFVFFIFSVSFPRQACSLLFLCAVGHSVLGVFFYRVLSSVISAAFTSGMAIFLLAELAPHVVCSGYGFQIGPALTWLAQVCMVLTCPLSCPLGLILDLALRRDITTCGIRERAMEMIRTSVNDPYRSDRVVVVVGVFGKPPPPSS